MKSEKLLFINRQKKEFFIVVILFFITFLFLQNSPVSIWRCGETWTDSSVFKTIALQMSQGYIPYKDTFDHKGPLIYILNLLGQYISYYRGIWVIEFITIFLTLFFMYKISRLCCGRLMSLSCVLVSITLLFTYFDGGNLTEEYAMPFIAGALYIFLDYFKNEKISKFRLMACGFSFGSVCLLRPNMIAIWCIFCIAVFIQCCSQKTFKKLFKFLLFFIIGFLVITAPIIIWLASNKSLTFFWQDYIKFNMIYSKTSLLSKYKTCLYFAKEEITLISIFAIIWLYHTRKKILDITYLIFLLFSLLLVSLSGVSFPHYGMVLVPTVVYPIAELVGLCEDTKSNKNTYGITIILYLYLLVTIVMPHWITHLSLVGDYYTSRNTCSISTPLQDLCHYISTATSEEQHISVYGNYNIIYVLSKRLPATTYSYQSTIGHITPYMFDEYFDQLKAELPELIITVEENGHLKDPENRMKEFLNQNNYHQVQRYDYDKQNGFVVYQR